jgi:uncharacterized protein YcbK (DUF882 family)
MEKLQEFLDENNIKYFRAIELVTGENRGNTYPNEFLWPNILPTLKVLDQVREKHGRIRVNSCYRNEYYNGKVGGSKESLHKQFKACDIVPLDDTIDNVLDTILKLIPMNSWGLRKYETFIHLDCREWRYREL